MLFGVGVVEREEYTLACKIFEQREVVLALLYLFAVYLFDDCSGLDFCVCTCEGTAFENLLYL